MGLNIDIKIIGRAVAFRVPQVKGQRPITFGAQRECIPIGQTSDQCLYRIYTRWPGEVDLQGGTCAVESGVNSPEIHPLIRYGIAIYGNFSCPRPRGIHAKPFQLPVGKRDIDFKKAALKIRGVAVGDHRILILIYKNRSSRRIGNPVGLQISDPGRVGMRHDKCQAKIIVGACVTVIAYFKGNGITTGVQSTPGGPGVNV